MKTGETKALKNLLKIVKESWFHFSGTLIQLFLGYVLLVIITRFLKPAEYGTFTLAQAILEIVLMLSLLGLPTALSRFLPYYNAVKQCGKSKFLIKKVLALTLALSFAWGLITFLSADYLNDIFFGKALLPQVLRILVWGLPLLVLIKVISACFIGYKELRYPMYFIQLGLPLLKIALALTIFSAGYNLLGWSWMYLFSLAGSAGLAVWFWRKKILATLNHFAPEPVNFKKVFSYSWPLSINVIIIFLLAQATFILLGHFRPAEEVGIFRIYYYLTFPLLVFQQALEKIYQPIASECLSRGETKVISVIYHQVSKWFVITVSLGFMVVVFGGRELVTLLFTKQYLTSPAVLIVLAAAYLARSLAGPNSATLVALGNTRLIIFNSLLMLFSNILVGFLLIPSWGILGATVAVSVAIIIGSLASLLEVYKIHNLQPFTKNHWRFLTAFLLTAGITCLIKIFLPVNNPFLLVSMITLMISLYLCTLLRLGGLNENELKIAGAIRKYLFSFRALKHRR